MNHVWSGWSRRCTIRPTSSAPAVSMSADSSSRLASVVSSSDPGNVTPTSTMRSRTARSMSVAPSASLYGLWLTGSRCSATKVAGPVSVACPGRVERHFRAAAVHVHDEFRLSRRRRAPTGTRPTPRPPRRCRRPRVIPAPRSWTRIVMASAPGPGSMISRLTSGTKRPSVSRSTAVTSSTPTTVCGLPTARWATGRSGLAPIVGPPGGRGDLDDLAHLHGGEHGQRILRREQLDAPDAGIGGDALRQHVAAAGGERLGEAADAVAAHLGPAAIGVVQRHRRGEAVSGLTDEQPVGADAPCAVAHAGGRARRGRRHRGGRRPGSRCRGRGAWSTSFVQCVPRPRRPRNASMTTGAASATGSCSTSIQRTRGSRRNHRS